MKTINLTCVECPLGCDVEVTVDGTNVIEVKGNTCPRGLMYAKNEVTCPMRVLTTTVKTDDGRLVSVKTDKPVKKADMFIVMEKINKVVAKAPVCIGDVLVVDIADGANLVATDNLK